MIEDAPGPGGEMFRGGGIFLESGKIKAFPIEDRRYRFPFCEHQCYCEAEG